MVMLGLASCRWITARFTLEFAWLMIVGAVICTEAAFSLLEEVGIAVKPIRIACMAICTLSIVAGLLLPFSRIQSG